MAGLFTDPDKIIYGLMQIYGSEADIVPAKIKEMRNLKPPKPDDYPHIQKNLHKLKLSIQYIEEQGESARLEANVVHEIVNTSMDSDLLKQYNKEFMEFRTKQKVNLIGVKPEVTESNFALYFDSDKLQAERLKFLVDFIENALEYQLIYHKGARAIKGSHPSNQSEHLPDSQPSFLINKQEQWVCELCKTNH